MSHFSINIFHYFILDFFKGFIAVILVNLLKADPEISVAWLINLKILAVFCAVLGHIFPIFANFKGGKGVATVVGAVMGINPPVVLLCFAIWAVINHSFHIQYLLLYKHIIPYIN